MIEKLNWKKETDIPTEVNETEKSVNRSQQEPLWFSERVPKPVSLGVGFKVELTHTGKEVKGRITGLTNIKCQEIL